MQGTVCDLRRWEAYWAHKALWLVINDVEQGNHELPRHEVMLMRNVLGKIEQYMLAVGSRELSRSHEEMMINGTFHAAWTQPTLDEA